ncbi:C-C motif chemokine 5-like [Hipposideros larvatus]
MKVSGAAITCLLVVFITIFQGSKSKLSPRSALHKQHCRVRMLPGMVLDKRTRSSPFHPSIQPPPVTPEARLVTYHVQPQSLHPITTAGGPYHPLDCCFTHVTHRVQRQRIIDYYETSSQCSKPGVVFITKKGYFICANPSDDWVQDYITKLREIRGTQE